MNLITAPAQVGYAPVATAIVHSTTASLTSRAPVQPVHLVQYDQTMPVIAVALTANGQPYTVPSGAAVNVRMDKPDGAHVYNPALGVSTDGQTAYIGITAQMTAAAGGSGPIVEIVVNGGVAGTAAFPVIIDLNPVPDSAYESTDEYLTLYEILQQAQDAAQIVQQNAQNLQNVTDNLEAIQNAAANAQAAAQSAQEAQTAAQQALGFRTLFSAVSPDENGDLDPSRPMTTPTAQASWTIKSKGDRIQSVQVNGFTTQAGTGDPSPTNVREISTAGMRMVAVTFDGSSDENWSFPSTGGANTQFISLQENYNVSTNTVVLAYCDRLKKVLPTFPGDDPTENNTFTAFCSPLGTLIFKVNLGASSIANLRAILSSNPLTIWYVPADESQATGLYIPIQAQGREYRCQCVELTAPLCKGDTLKTRVKSGCDVKLIFDGSSDENWSQGILNESIRYLIPVENIPVTDAQNGKGFSNYLYLAASGGTGIAENKYCFTIASNGNLYVKTDGTQTLQEFKELLNKENLVVYLRSTAYTEANDIPVSLEVHAYNRIEYTGDEVFYSASVVGEMGYYFFQNLDNANTGGTNQSDAVCSHLTNQKGIFDSVLADTKADVFCVGSSYSPRFIISHEALGTSSSSEVLECKDAAVAYLKSQYAQGTPMTLVCKMKTPAIYARDPVDLVAVPYTEADATAAQQLASTPVTLPYIDSADVPMLLNKTTEAEPAAHPMTLAAPLAPTLPVAGTYVVSSQDGTTVLVSLKAMQDGGDAATLEGMTANQILAQTPTALSVGVLSVISAQATISSVPVGTTGTAFSAALTVPDGYTALDPLYISVGSAGAVANLDAFASGAGAVTGTVYNLTQAELQNVSVTVHVLGVKIGG